MCVVFVRKGVGVLAPLGAILLPVISGRMKPHINLDGVEYKHCSKCNSWRPLIKYYRSSSTVDKLQSFCSSCQHGSHVSKSKFIKVSRLN